MGVGTYVRHLAMIHLLIKNPLNVSKPRVFVLQVEEDVNHLGTAA